MIVASDEVGYGAWAGPLVVCAVAVPNDWTGPPELKDSKELGPDGCVAIYHLLQKLPMALMSVDNVTIDKIGVKEALLRAHTEAIKRLLVSYPSSDVVVDGSLLLPELPQARCIPRADSIFPSVSAASVIAKVNRDWVMKMRHEELPYYAWHRNKGYHSKAHIDGLKKYGVSVLHRRSYSPVRALLENP